jgi:hypothetical protein
MSGRCNFSSGRADRQYDASSPRKGYHLGDDDIRKQLLIRHHLRVEAEMSRYIGRCFADSASLPEAIHVMGGDARTGVALRKTVTASDLTLSPPTPRR